MAKTNHAPYTEDYAANDYYIYMCSDHMVLQHSLTLEEALYYMRNLEAGFPEDADNAVLAKASDDYKLAAERAFSHLLNW